MISERTKEHSSNYLSFKLFLFVLQIKSTIKLDLHTAMICMQAACNHLRYANKERSREEATTELETTEER